MSQIDLLEFEYQQDYLIYSNTSNWDSNSINKPSIHTNISNTLSLSNEILFVEAKDTITGTMVNPMSKSNSSNTNMNTAHLSKNSTNLKRKVAPPPPILVHKDIKNLDDSSSIIPKRSPARLFDRFKLTSPLKSTENFASSIIANRSFISKIDKRKDLQGQKIKADSDTDTSSSNNSAPDKSLNQPVQSQIHQGDIQSMETITPHQEPTSPVSSYNDSRSTFDIEDGAEEDSASSNDESSNHSFQLNKTHNKPVDNSSILTNSSKLIKKALEFEDEEMDEDEIEEELNKLFDAVNDAEIAKIDDIIQFTGQYNYNTTSNILVSN
ncbi:uncharacterized protein KGF55_003052 [Candida pseudojiufengensis]|uniref:uncharacterized protein n=1 Tax=Candida pseudojiufengensis TaxID=497109 RepID=UPI002224A1D6|nr:uncharacterized protein KGF55_003052 [Candida pseudojiufengensis]KAI5963260.1 hypothetical protein KGF55_003052 [Candida pseudojiufengensis]